MKRMAFRDSVFLDFFGGSHYLFSFSLLGHSKLDTFLTFFFLLLLLLLLLSFTPLSSYGKPGTLLNHWEIQIWESFREVFGMRKGRQCVRLAGRLCVCRFLWVRFLPFDVCGLRGICGRR